MYNWNCDKCYERFIKAGDWGETFKKMTDGAEGLFDLFREVKEGFSEKVELLNRV